MSQVNFLLTHGDLQPGYRRALKSAEVHGVPIVLWCANRVPPDLTGLKVELRPLLVPDWLKASSKHQAHIFDVMAYQIGFEQGGLVLGLDTISVRPALDLLGKFECVVSTDWAEGDANCGIAENGAREPFNNNFIARKGSDAMGMLWHEAKRVAKNDSGKWGLTGPCLLPQFVKSYPNLFGAAPYPAMCGWSPGYIWKFYLGLEPVPETCRVIHLCRTAYIELWEGRYSDWMKHNPYFAAERKTSNDELLSYPV